MVVQKLGNKHIFWQAFLIASVVFWVGILLGINFERARIDSIESFYFDSENDLFDFELASDVVYNSDLDCSVLYEKSVVFAEDIFKEASKLEKYDDSNKISKELIALHRRYDLLRINLWQNVVEVNDKCEEDVNTVIYFYDYVEPDLTTKALQGTMSSFLIEMKEKYGQKIILIPVATDTGAESLSILLEKYEFERIPAILVNEESAFDSIESLTGFESALI